MQDMYGSTVIVRKQLSPANPHAIARPQVPERHELFGLTLELNGDATRDVRGRQIAVLDTARRVQVISRDPRVHSVQVFGYNSQQAPIRERLEFPAGGGTRSSFFDYHLVMGVRPDDDEEWTGQVEIGTNSVGSTAPQIPAHYQAIFNIGFDVTVEGAANCSIEATRDVASALPYIYVDGHQFFQPKVHWFSWTTLENITNDKFSDIDSPVNAWRLTVHSGDGLCIARAIPIGLRT